MKKIILINYLLAPLGKMNQSLLQQGSILREAKDYQLIFLSASKTNRGLRKFCEESLISINEIEFLSWSGIYDELFTNAEKYPENWETAVTTIINHILGRLKEEHGWDGDSHNLFQFLFGGVLTEFLTSEAKLIKQLKTRKGMGFSTPRNSILKGLLSFNLIKNHGVRTKHLVFDPCEVQYDSLLNSPQELYIKYHGYNSKLQNLTRCDSLQYYLLQKFGHNFYNNSCNNIRNLDFVFGASVLAASRVWIDEIITDLKLNLNPQTSRIYYTNKYLKIDEFVNRETYLSFISQAKYTLIVRSYDSNSFSTYRAIESVFRGCIPLLHTDSNWQILSESFVGLEENWLRETLVVSNSTEIKNKIQNYGETKRKEVLDRLYSSLFRSLVLPKF